MEYVTYSDAISSNITSYVVGGLQPATQYVIRLAAVNQAGRGSFTPSPSPVTTFSAGMDTIMFICLYAFANITVFFH